MIDRRNFLKTGFFFIGGLIMSTVYDPKELCLTSDTLPPHTFDKIEIRVDQFRPFLINPMKMPDGKQRVFYDVSQLPHGKHEVWIRGMKGRQFGPVTTFQFRR